MRILTLVPLTLLATPALAFGPPGDIDREERFEKAMTEIDATDAQRTTIRSFVDETLPALRSFHDEAHTLRGEMRALFLEPTVDRAAVEYLRVDAVDLVDRATTTVLDLVVDAANVLSVDQRATLQELRERHRPRHSGQH